MVDDGSEIQNSMCILYLMLLTFLSTRDEMPWKGLHEAPSTHGATLLLGWRWDLAFTMFRLLEGIIMKYIKISWNHMKSIKIQPVMPVKHFRSLRRSGCALADYNLTMDGSTGAITKVPGTAVHTEPFSIECTVTAHQSVTTTFEAKVRIAMDWFAYGIPLLLFPGSNSFPASKAAGSWKDFAVRCAPNTAWLQVGSTGTLTKSGSIGTGGVTTEDAAISGQSGGVCVVTALHQPIGGKWQLRQAKVMAIWPQPWASMSYQTSSVSVTLGEQLPLLKLPVSSASGQLKPNEFFVACDTTPSLKWSFDSLLSTGLLEGGLALLGWFFGW